MPLMRLAPRLCRISDRIIATLFAADFRWHSLCSIAKKQQYAVLKAVEEQLQQHGMLA